VNGLDNSGKTPLVTVKQTCGMLRRRSLCTCSEIPRVPTCYRDTCYRYTVLGLRFVKIANDWRVVANCKRG